MNGLSDHDAQLLIINKITVRPPAQYTKLIRTLDKDSLNDFLNKLSYERWDTTFSSEDVNIMFNAFLDTNLKIFYSSFPKKIKQLKPKMNDWITLGIRISCSHKCEIYVASKNNPDLRDYYKKYSKILSSGINK